MNTTKKKGYCHGCYSREWLRRHSGGICEMCFAIRKTGSPLNIKEIHANDTRLRSQDDQDEIKRRILIYSARATAGLPLFEPPAWPEQIATIDMVAILERLA